MKRTKLKFIGLLLLVLPMALLSCQKEDDENTINNNNNDDVNIILPEIEGYPIVGTNQTSFFNNINEISEPSAGQNFYGQNAHYPGNTPQYHNNGDGTVTDLVSGLMWQQSFDHNEDGSIDYSDKLTYDEIVYMIEGGVSFAGYDDWRLPSIKEMYSLIQFSGRDISPESTNESDLTPFIDDETFAFAYGDLDAGERLIDMQCATSNIYVSNEVEETVFGVNFADGRIKGYGTAGMGGGRKAFNYLLVRANESYGINKFSNNGDGTISDLATGLMWMQDDSGEAMLWKDALEYAENFEFAGYDDWRLPDTKELQSIVDYTRSPAATNSAAIDAMFNSTEIINEAGQADYGFYFTSTTHANSSQVPGGAAAYVAFGRSLGNMNGWIDIHGAGSQRSDPKTGNPEDYSEGFGPQGDAIRIYNYVRLVRNIK